MCTVCAALVAADRGKTGGTAELGAGGIGVAGAEAASLIGAAILPGVATFFRHGTEECDGAAQLLLQEGVEIAPAIAASLIGAALLTVGATLPWVGAAGEVGSAAGLLFDRGVFREEAGQADRAIGTALPVAALQLVGAAIEAAFEVRRRAGVGSGSRRRRRCRNRRWGAGRWWRNRGPAANGTGIGVGEDRAAGYRRSAETEQALEDGAARGASADRADQCIEALVVHGCPCPFVSAPLPQRAKM
jgi:hypothetical protein